jgi:flagellar biosynthesis chaperone FliJ
MKQETMELVERVRERELTLASRDLESIARLIRETNTALAEARQQLGEHGRAWAKRAESGVHRSELVSAAHEREQLVDYVASLERRLEVLEKRQREAVRLQELAMKRVERHRTVVERHQQARQSERASAAQRQLDERAGYDMWLRGQNGDGSW